MRHIHPAAPCLASWLVASLVSGCAAVGLPVDAERALEESLALEHALAFHADGVPLDVLPAEDNLTLDGAVRLALESSPELQGALARVRVAQAEADLARLLPNPVLDLLFRFPEGGGRPSVEVGLAANLLAILQRPRRSDAARRRLEAAAATALSVALDVLAETQELYADAQALDRLVPLHEERLEGLDRLLEVARARLAVGEGPRSEVQALEAERLELEVDTAARRQDQRLARLGLARRVGQPSGTGTWELDPWSAPASPVTDESIWIATALRARPEVQAIEWEIGARVDETSLARGGVLDGALGIGAEREERASLGPGATIPLPVFDTGSARARRARALESEARHRLTEIQRAVVEQVRGALVALAGTQQNLTRVVGELLPLQVERLHEAQEAFRRGHVDVTVPLLASQALQTAQIRHLELEREASKALVRLQRAVGGPAAVARAVTHP